MVDEDSGNEFYPYALYSCGWIQLKRGDYEKGFTFFHQVYEKSPTHPIAQPSLFWSGYCLYQIDHYEQAVREIEVLLRTFPKGIWRPEAEYLMGISLFRLQKFNEAADLFRNFWIRFPQHPLEESARYAYAWSLVSLGQYEEGRKTFEEVLLTFPERQSFRSHLLGNSKDLSWDQ